MGKLFKTLGGIGFCATMAMAATDRITVDTKPIFASGMNLAWIDFANDAADAPLDENKMRKSIQDLRDAGGNAMRWWILTNASKSPTFDANGYVDGIGVNTVANIKKALDIAEENGVVLSLCLLSFDLMQSSQIGSWNHMSIANNVKMLTTDAGITALVDNAIIPIVKGVGYHKAIMSWEVFNEPEGMSTEFGWTPTKVAMADIQKVTNRIAAAVHDNVSGVLVSSGTHSFWANSDVPTCGNCKNYYSDSELIAAGGKANGTLDFYQVHYYPEHFGDDRNPFAHPASYWGLDKPIVIGEFPAGDWDGNTYSKYKHTMTNKAAFEWAYAQGYAGAMSWDINGFSDNITPGVQNLETSKGGLTSLYTDHKADILIKDVVREDKSGNGVMQIDIVNAPAEINLERQKDMNWSAATKLTVDVKVLEGSAFTFSAVSKLTSAWTWTEYEECTVPADGKWMTCEFDLTSSSTDRSLAKSILFRSFDEGYTGKILFDNVKAGDLVIDDFNTEFDLWTVVLGADEATASTKYGEDITAININPALNTLGFSIKNQILSLNKEVLNSLDLEVFSANGEFVSLIKMTENGSFANANLSAFAGQKLFVKVNSLTGTIAVPVVLN